MHVNNVACLITFFHIFNKFFCCYFSLLLRTTTKWKKNKQRNFTLVVSSPFCEIHSRVRWVTVVVLRIVWRDSESFLPTTTISLLLICTRIFTDGRDKLCVFLKLCSCERRVRIFFFKFKFSAFWTVRSSARLPVFELGPKSSFVFISLWNCSLKLFSRHNGTLKAHLQLSRILLRAALRTSDQNEIDYKVNFRWLRWHHTNFKCFSYQNLYCSSVIATAGALTSQKMNGHYNPRSVLAYTMFGAAVAGPFAHFFYQLINSVVPDVRGRRVLEFLMERFTFAPCFCALSLFFLTIFEGKSVDQATQNLARMYKSVLLANWKYLTFPVFLNFNFVPPMLRVFVSNIIGFFWVIYLADKRRRAAAAAAKKDKTT